MALPSSRSLSEEGSGLVSTMLGAVTFLAFLALATNVLVGLYATSAVTAISTDAVQNLAASPSPPGPAAFRTAEAYVRARLGSLKGLELEWITTDDGRLGLHVRAESPALLPVSLRTASPRSIDRTAWARQERLR